MQDELEKKVVTIILEILTVERKFLRSPNKKDGSVIDNIYKIIVDYSNMRY